MEIASREQLAVSEFMRASDPMRQIAEDGHGGGLPELSAVVIQAISSFGVSELYARQAERCKALRVQSSRVQLASKMSAYHNKKGLRTLSYARTALKQFRDDLESYPKATNLAKAADALQQELRDGLVDLEIKPSDVEKIDKALQEGFDVVRSSSTDRLADYLEEKLKKLEQVRRRKDRGAVENVPIWKVAAIVVAVGIWVWALFRCSIFGRCSLAEGLAYFILGWIFALIARFC